MSLDTGGQREELSQLRNLQSRVPSDPYSILLRLQLAKAYKSLGYPDLAVGEAYKALLLIDEVVEDGEYHEDAIEAVKADIRSTENISAIVRIDSLSHAQCRCSTDAPTDKPVDIDEDVADWARSCWSKTA